MKSEEAPKPFSDAYSTLESLRALAATWNDSPPMHRIGARLEFDRVDRVRAVIDPVMPYHRGGMGTDAVNGPVLAGLFDLVIGTVGWLSRPDSRSATVTLSMTFLRPTRGDRVLVEVAPRLAEELTGERDVAVVDEIHLAHVHHVGQAGLVRDRHGAVRPRPA